MAEEKIIEKRYIEVNPSAKKRFLVGVAGGLGWGVGFTFGTAALLALLGFLVSEIDFVPILGKFLSEVIVTAQSNLTTR